MHSHTSILRSRADLEPVPVPSSCWDCDELVQHVDNLPKFWPVVLSSASSHSISWWSAMGQSIGGAADSLRWLLNHLAKKKKKNPHEWYVSLPGNLLLEVYSPAQQVACPLSCQQAEHGNGFQFSSQEARADSENCWQQGREASCCYEVRPSEPWSEDASGFQGG